jgi:hypothetical protein
MTSPDASLACTCDPPVRFIWWTDNHRDELDAPPDAGTPVEDRLVLSCCLQTDAFVLAIEDARATRLPTGTTAYTRRHHLSRCIEAVRALADRRLFGVGVVAGPDFSEPQRPVILEGLPHLEREEAEDLYAAYWGWCTIDRLADALAQPTNL